MGGLPAPSLGFSTAHAVSFCLSPQAQSTRSSPSCPRTTLVLLRTAHTSSLSVAHKQTHSGCKEQLGRIPVINLLKNLKDDQSHSLLPCFLKLFFSSPLLSYHIPPVPTPKTSNANSLFKYFQSPRPQSPLLHFIPPPLTFPAMFLPPQHKTPATQEAARTLFEGWRQRIRWLPIPHLDSCSYPLNLLISKTHLPS